MKNKEKEIRISELIKTSSRCNSLCGTSAKILKNNSGQTVENTLTWYCFTALVPFCHKQHVYKKCYGQLVGRKD